MEHNVTFMGISAHMYVYTCSVHVYVYAFFCSCAATPVSVDAYASVSACMWRPEADVEHHPCSLFHLIRGGRLSQSHPELTDVVSFAIQIAQVIPCLPSEAGHNHPVYPCVSRDPNSSPYAC